MAINDTLKFSWGHIIAFVAIIVISYLSFMGIAYLFDGNFLYAGGGVAIIDLLLIVFFILPQILKGTDERFKHRIVFERILLFGSPLLFVITMVPYAHFWTVYNNRNNIEMTFSESITKTKDMFVLYEDYANSRIREYDKKLVEFKTESIRRNNKVEALRLQLVDNNYTALKNSAFKWIDNASEATVWNAFMIGNIKTIERALEGWNESLANFSNKILSDEPEGVNPFPSEDTSVASAKTKLVSLQKMYTLMEMPTLLSIGIGLFLFGILLIPYFIQNRNTKSTYRLIGSEQNGTFTIDKDDFIPSNSDDYGSFTL
jgi:hypothetical protein